MWNIYIDTFRILLYGDLNLIYKLATEGVTSILHDFYFASVTTWFWFNVYVATKNISVHIDLLTYYQYYSIPSVEILFSFKNKLARKFIHCYVLFPRAKEWLFTCYALFGALPWKLWLIYAKLIQFSPPNS